MVKWVQAIYDGIKNWQAPQWMKVLLQQLNDLMIALLKQVSKAYIDYLKGEIIYASQQNWTSEEKFKYVFNQAKKGLTEFIITLKDSEINVIIEYLVNLLKKEGVIK